MECLYESTATRVYLVRHRQLNVYRIIKCLSKTHTDNCHNFLEANLLVQLSHPGIPQIYDLEETGDTLYMIEEYVQGQSLNEYLLYHNHISQFIFFQIAIQICLVLEYLHENKPNPILYQDMKPDHIIVCGNQVKLIDFGIAFAFTSQGNHFQKYGSAGYAAPEQFSQDNISVKTDIYGVGRILQLLAEHSTLKNNLFLKYLIGRTTAAKPALRPDSIRWLRTRLEQMSQGSLEKEEIRPPVLFIRKNHFRISTLLHTIAVIGNDTGVGVTHIAISLCVFLRKKNYQAYYMNKTGARILQKIQRSNREYQEENGIIYHDYFHGIPEYVDNVVKREPPGGILVLDYEPTQWEEVQADLVLCVINGRPWKAPEYCELPENMSHMYLICNQYCTGAAKKYARAYREPVYGFPTDQDPFLMSKQKEQLFTEIFQKEMEDFYNEEKMEAGGNHRNYRSNAWSRRNTPGN